MGEMILTDPVVEARRLVDTAAVAGVEVRAMGGVAVSMRAPSLARIRPARVFHDIDLIGERREKGGLTELLSSQGYLPHSRFNALAGGLRLLFHAPDGRRLDVFLDRVEMCHTLELRHRLRLEPLTLPLSDLLLTKLQIVQLTGRDLADLAALFMDHPLGAGGIDTERVIEVCSADWGWWRTVTINLEKVRSELSSGIDGLGPAEDAVRRVEELAGLLETSAKTTAWKLRSLVGDRLQWYDEPEEVR